MRGGDVCPRTHFSRPHSVYFKARVVPRFNVRPAAFFPPAIGSTLRRSLRHALAATPHPKKRSRLTGRGSSSAGDPQTAFWWFPPKKTAQIPMTTRPSSSSTFRMPPFFFGFLHPLFSSFLVPPPPRAPARFHPGPRRPTFSPPHLTTPSPLCPFLNPSCPKKTHHQNLSLPPFNCTHKL